MLALGQLLVIVTRGIDLSVGSTLALLGRRRAPLRARPRTLLVIAVILATGFAVGLANGLVFVYGRIPHPFIVTLATLSIARGLALWAANGTLISGMPQRSRSSARTGPASPVLVLRRPGARARRARRSRPISSGAAGSTPSAATPTPRARAGIPVGRVLVSVYALSGLAAGVGGLLTAGLIDAGSPNSGDLAELDSIAAVIIGGAAFAGGRGNVGNALVGAFTIGVIRNAMNLHNVNAFYQLMAIGVVVLLAVEGDVIRGPVERRVRVARAVRPG